MIDNTTDFELLFDNETTTIEIEILKNVTKTKLSPLPWPARPAPSWDEVKAQLKWVFLLHTYGFACSFLVLGFYCFFSILNIRSLIAKRPFMSTINVFLCLLGGSRAVYLFIDPYGLKEVLPRAMGGVLWDVGFPSILSAFALVQLALLQLTQLRTGPEFIRHKSCLSLVITVHFACVIAVDLYLTLHSNLIVLKYMVETLFLLWGMMVCCTFLYAGYRAMELLKNMPSAMLERDVDVQYKDSDLQGIMQLAMLAPYNNLASSVAAALVPTLLAPKLAAEARRQNSVQEPSSSNKTEPAKSCIIAGRTSAKMSPTSSDNEENKDDNKDKRTKKLSWSSDQRNPNQPTSKSPYQGDLTLHTILNHIAYVNRAPGHESAGHVMTDLGATRKQQVSTVLKMTMVTAVLCFALIISQIIGMYSPRAWLWDRVRPWLLFQTLCRTLELIMACAMANMTKQPVTDRSLQYRYSMRSKTPQSMFM